MSRVGVGILGCGKISSQYFRGCAAHDVLKVVACADQDPERARQAGEEFGVGAVTVDELLHHPEVEVVVNLTVPQAHAPVNRAILEAGRHAYTEKPFGLTVAEAADVMGLAARRGLRVGSAPDTFLGSGVQTARHALDAGRIGIPVAGLAFMLCRGHESWHPAPEFYYQRGGGPVFDMGPYYLTALIALLGPVRRVCASARATFPERVITSQPQAGRRIPVEVSTHCAGTLDFANGAVVTLIMSFDTWPGPVLPPLTVYGSEGTLVLPDPNGFDGDVRLHLPGAEPELVVADYAAGRGRGSGVADLAHAWRGSDRPHRASAELALHVVEIMEALETSSLEARHVTLSSLCARPAALPTGLAAGVFDS
jgi:predicted dehydrogenase